MKKSCLVFYLLLLVFVAQSQTQEPYKYLGNYTQPAPNVAALGKYVDYPVGYYTGTPSISIPLYDLQDGAAKTSISLSYHASGIHVAELSSSVGLGWALNAGGMITRSVRGGPDDGVFYSQTDCGGYYRDSGIRKMPILTNPDNFNDPNAVDEREWFLNLLSNGNADLEPDLFTFNFNGYGGKFVFDENKTPRLLTDNDVKIAVDFNGSFQSWIITTPDGAKYYFGENNVREVDSVYSSSTGLDNNTLKPSSWLLTRIIYPNTKDTIYFNYATETYSYFDLGQETTIYDAASTYGISSACLITPRPTNVYKTAVNGYRLTNITSRNYKIVFGVNTANARQDLKGNGSSYPYKLDSVKVYNSQNQCLKQYVLSYGYFSSSTANNMYSPVLSFLGGDTTDTKRLKLLSVKEYAGDGATSKPAYVFNYEETYQLPRRLSYDIDHWGFSNNYSGNTNDRFTPTVYYPICTSSQTGANRNPKWPDMQQYSIKSIKDPLGVLTGFEFEAHRSSLSTPTDLVGGLRIKKITTTDSVTGISNIRSYSYGNGGTLYKVPKYLYFPNNEYYYQTGSISIGGYRGYNFSYGSIITCAIKQSQSIVPLQDFQGNHIGYPIVKETFGTNSEGGYKIYSFMADQLPAGNSRLDMSNYTASATISSQWFGNVSGIFGNGHFNDISPQNLTYFTGYNVDDYYPAAPTQVDFRRGQLLTEDTYDSAGARIRNVRNTYSETYHEDAWIRGFKLFRTTAAVYQYSDPVYGYHANFTGYNDAMTYYKLHTGISHPTSTVTTEYKDSKSFTSVAYYKYESTNHTLKTQDSTVNSIGDAIVNKTYYSFDYTNNVTTDTVIGKMKSRNMLLPVATRTWKNNQLLSGTVTLYKDFSSSGTDTFVNPSKIYALEITTPLTTTQAGENVPLSGQFSTLLPDTFFREKASFNIDGTTGKIKEQKLIDDKTQALIWDTKLSLPLSVTDNAVISDVAYSSFESAETGNWTYSSGSVTSDATAPTGGKAYSISGGVSKSGLASAQKYILSYWLKSGGSASISGGTQTNSISGRTLNGWTYKQITITGATSISLSGSGGIDEVRLHPADAQMTTYTYDGLMRLIAQCSPNNSINYYEYDSMNRLVDIKDQYGNVVKAFEYNYGRAARPQ